jgi:signal transduction histidine kinase/DNA-binding response OmpR family regulator
MATVLVVDDEPAVRTYLVGVLGAGGHRFLEASDGAQALALVRAQRPDVVISDILMPAMDGYEFVRQLRADPASAHTPVIFHTAAYHEREARALAEACGVTHRIDKPSHPQTVLRVVGQVLAGRPAAPPPPDPEHFDREHLRLLTDTLAAKVNELRAVNGRLTALIHLGQQLTLERDPLRVVEGYCQTAREVIGARYAAIGLLDGDGQGLGRFFISGLGAGAAARIRPPAPQAGLVGRVLTERRPLRVGDLRADPGAAAFLPPHPRQGPFLGVAIASSCQLYGLLYLMDKLGGGEFSEGDEELAVTMAAQVGVAYRAARQYDDIQRHAAQLQAEVARREQAEKALQDSRLRLQVSNRRLEVLREIDRAILAAQSPHEIATAALSRIRSLVPCRRAVIMVFDLQAQQATLLAVNVEGPTALGTGGSLPLAALGDMEDIWQGNVRLVEDFRALSALPPLLQTLQAEGVRSFLAVPLTAQGKLIGSLNLGADAPGAFTPDRVEVAREVATSLAVAIHGAQLFELVRAGRERLQTLSHHLLEVQEAERRYLARELHDEIGQLLTALQLALDRHGRAPADPAPAGPCEAQALVRELLGRVREMSIDLRPAMLDELGLRPTVLWYCERYAARTGVRVAVKHAGVDRRFPAELETAAYRIVQESLTNVARHAGVPEATVRVWADPDTLHAQVEDHGAGFDPEAVLAAGSTSGLAGMRERALLLGGQLTVDSAPGGGTCVTAELPLADGRTERRGGRAHDEHRAGR